MNLSGSIPEEQLRGEYDMYWFSKRSPRERFDLEPLKIITFAATLLIISSNFSLYEEFKVCARDSC